MCAENVSEKRDKSQGRYAWSTQPEATGRHRNQRDWLNKCLGATRWLTGWAWEGPWREGGTQGPTNREEEEDWGQQRGEDWAVRKEPALVRNRLEETGQEEPCLGRVSTRKRVPLRSLAGNGNFTPTPAISKYLRAPLEKKKKHLPLCNWFIWRNTNIVSLSLKSNSRIFCVVVQVSKPADELHNGALFLSLLF